MNKYWKYIVVAFVLLAIGFLAGRWTIKTKVKIEYIKGETIRDTIYSEKLVPYKVVIPDKPVLIMKFDTIRIPGQPEYIVMKVDTAQIIAEYIKENSYRNTLFDNQTEGKLTVDAIVQYNKMQRLGYEFTPMQKQITIEKRRILTPFASGSYNSFGYFGIGGGLFYYDLGIGAKYITNFNQSGYEIGLQYKF